MLRRAAYTDSDPLIARGTPMERPKIGNSIVDVIGGTPIVRTYYPHFRSHAIPYFIAADRHHAYVLRCGADQAESSSCGLPRNHLAQVGKHGTVQQRQGPHWQEHDRGGRKGRQDFTWQNGAGGAHVGEHGYWTGDGRGGKRLRADPDDACVNVAGKARAS